MTTHLTKIWWDLNKHKLVEQTIPEAEIYKREWVGLTENEIEEIARWADKNAAPWYLGYAYAIEQKLKEKNSG